MNNNYAAILDNPGQQLKLVEVETHSPGAGEVLIENHAIALQPLDAKMLIAGYGGGGQLQYPAVLGSSGAGLVRKLGMGVQHLQVGDRVVFDTDAYVKADTNRRKGTWQRLVISDASTVAKIGDTAFEQAGLIDFPLQTAVAAMRVFLGMGKEGSVGSEDKVLIWGAGGAVGSYAVQYAKSLGFTVVVTASPRDIDRQKRLGASEVVDYKSPTVVDELRKIGPYKYLFTASGDGASQQALAALLADGGRFASVLPKAEGLPSNVEVVYSAFSQAAQRDEFADWRKWYFGTYLSDVFGRNLVEAVKFTKIDGGLGALQQAAQDVFDEKVRGKLVLHPQE